MNTNQEATNIQSHIDEFRTEVMTQRLIAIRSHSVHTKDFEEITDSLASGNRHSSVNRECSYDYSTGNRFQFSKSQIENEKLVDHLKTCLNRTLGDSLVGAYESHRTCIAGLAISRSLPLKDAYKGDTNKKEVSYEKVLSHLRELFPAFKKHEWLSPPMGVMGGVECNLSVLSLMSVITQMRHSIVHKYGTFDWDVCKESTLNAIRKSPSSEPDNRNLTIELHMYVRQFLREHNGKEKLEFVDRSGELSNPGFDRLYKHLFNVILYYTHMAYGCLLDDLGIGPDWRNPDYLRRVEADYWQCGPSGVAPVK